jgi:amidase
MNSLISSSGEPAIPSLVKSNLLTTSAKSIHEVCALHRSRKRRRAVYDDLFNYNDLDGLLMPPGPHTAMPHEKWGPINYTALWNYLDFPACIIPVGKVTAQDVKRHEAMFETVDQSLYDLFKSVAHRKDSSYITDANDSQTLVRGDLARHLLLSSLLVKHWMIRGWPLLHCVCAIY